MGVITTSVPACQIWMVDKPLDGVQYGQPYSSLWPTYQTFRRILQYLIHKIFDQSIYIVSAIKEVKTLRRHARLLEMPYYNSLFKAAGTIPTKEDLKQHSKLNLMKLKLRKWCSSGIKNFRSDIQEVWGARRKEDELIDIELRHLRVNTPPLQHPAKEYDDKDGPWSDEDDASSQGSLPDDHLDNYLSNRNYNALFPSDDATALVGHEEVVAINNHMETDHKEDMTNDKPQDTSGVQEADPTTVLPGIRSWKETTRDVVHTKEI
ncbi:hypothetical protein ABW21_db0201606 [Orbilia brochopaga]|nr:hypothetical protein ABW21_db0201606 [Drechslerella brochopaga]